MTHRPDMLRADGRSRALLEARIEDRTGNPVSRAEVKFSVSAGDLGPVEKKDNRFHAWLTTPSGGAVTGSIEVTAEVVAPGAENRVARISVPLEKKVEAALPPTPEVPLWKRRSFYQWTSLGAGIAALVPGAVLMAIDGQGSCDASPGVQCPEVYDTLVPGAVLLGTGSALLVTAIILALTGQEPDGGGSDKGVVRIQPGAGQLVVTFSF